MQRSYKLIHCLGIFSLILMSASCNTRSKSAETSSSGEEDVKHIQLIRNDDEKKVDVLIDGSLFTSYLYPDTLKKPVLYPLVSPGGNFVTRGFPLHPRQGDRVDHPHHIGLWFNYGDVNGLDFWNNSNAIPDDEKEHYGHIVHQEIDGISGGNDKGELEVTLKWMGPDGRALLQENTTFVFSGSGDKRIIDRVTKLTALDKDVSLKDNKEGLLGIRVARQLEHPSDETEIFTDAAGNVTDIPKVNNEGVSGRYRSSEGTEGTEVWGTRANWMKLSGQINDEKVSLVILDHPENPGYPTYWHARGYGLFAANPLGQKAMSNGKEELNFRLVAGESVNFKYRIIIYSGSEVSDKQLDREFEEFSKSTK